MTVAYGYGLIYDDFPLCALLVDTNEDGLPDSNEIIVVATEEQMEWADYAYEQAQWDLYVANLAVDGALVYLGLNASPITAGGLTALSVALGGVQTPPVEAGIIEGQAELIFYAIKASGSIDSYQNMVWESLIVM